MHTLLHETLSQTRTLKDDLYMQLHTFPYAYDERICTYLIESLDEHGFLTSTIKEYAQCLQVSEDTIEDHLEILQSLNHVVLRHLTVSTVFVYNCYINICLCLNISFQIIQMIS